MARKPDWIIGGLIVTALIVFVAFFLLLLIGVGAEGEMELSGSGAKVAVVEVEGIIISPSHVVRQLKKNQKDESIKAIVLRIDSPGGGISASQEIYETVRRVRDGGKPVVASMGSVAASGGYYVALGADTIMANLGTTTGSIGVIAEIPNFAKLMDKIGVSVTVIKSGTFKDSGSPYRDITRDELKYFQSWIDNGYKQFVDVVTRERNLERRRVLRLADGRVFTGEQALEYQLIDIIGTYDDAIQLAADMGGITGEPKVYKERPNRLTLLDLLTSDVKSLVYQNVHLWPRMQYLATY